MRSDDEGHTAPLVGRWIIISVMAAMLSRISFGRCATRGSSNNNNNNVAVTLLSSLAPSCKVCSTPAAMEEIRAYERPTQDVPVQHSLRMLRNRVSSKTDASVASIHAQYTKHSATLCTLPLSTPSHNLARFDTVYGSGLCAYGCSGTHLSLCLPFHNVIMNCGFLRGLELPSPSRGKASAEDV